MSSSDFHFEYQHKEFPGWMAAAGIALLFIGAVFSIIGFITDPARASFDCIISFMFVLSIGVGALFLVALEYLVGAIWSVPFRRVAEILSKLLLFAPIIAIPVLFNLHDVFHWTHADAVANDKILSQKTPYLNEAFFIIRFVVFFLLMWLFYWLITSRSSRQDISADQNLTRKNVRTSAVFMPVLGITITYMAVDWMMSLEPHWFSTIFGVYYFGGTVLAALAAVTLGSVILHENGNLPGLKRDHFYSLGALMFAFTNFWAYIAFSQYLLIWYANIPEETFWFITRSEGSWMWISLGLILIRFIIPYAMLLSQPSKSNTKILKIASAWILFAHMYDLYWLIMPSFSAEGAVFGWIEIAFVLFTVGLVLMVFNFGGRRKNLIPVGDPKLKRAMEFHL